MPEAFRLRVQMALTALLEEINVADGYTHDMADRVFRGRGIYGSDDPLPMISILEEPIAPEADFGAASNASGLIFYPLMVQGFVPDDPLNPTDPAHVLLAHVKKKLADARKERDSATGLLGFGHKAPMVDKLDFDGGVVRPPDGEVSATAYFWLRVVLVLVEKHDDPFA